MYRFGMTMSNDIGGRENGITKSVAIMEYGQKEPVVIPQYASPSERENNELISELYSILYTINAIEKVFIKSIFKSDAEREQYSTTVDGLLVQWNSILDSLGGVSVPGHADNSDDDADSRIKQLLSRCVSSNEVDSLRFGLRRVKIGINGFDERKRDLEKEHSSEQYKASQKETSLAQTAKETEGDGAVVKGADTGTAPKKAIAEATSAFITLMDAIKLNYDSKDTLHPLFSDVLTKSGQVSTDFDGRNKLVSWLIRVNKMDIADTLDENELKEMLWDVDSAYNGFFNQL